MKNFTAIIVLSLLAVMATAQNKVREMANETYVNRAKTVATTKDGNMSTGNKKDGQTNTGNRDGVLISDRKGGETSSGNRDGDMGTGGKKGGETNNGNRDGDTPAVGENKDGETHQGNRDGEANQGNRDGVLVGDRKNGGKANAKDGVLVSNRDGNMGYGGKKDGDTNNGNRDGETNQGNRDGEANQGNRDGEANNGNRDGDTHQGNREGETGHGTKFGDIHTVGKLSGALTGSENGDKARAILNIFPNPATTQVNIQAPAGTTISYAQVLNMQGRAQATLNGNKNQNLAVNISGLNPGNYIFRIILSNGAVKTVNVVKK